LALPAADHQVLESVQPAHLLYIDCPPFMPQPQVDHPIAVAAMPVRHVDNALAQPLVAIVPTLVAKHAPAHTCHPQRMPFRQPSRSSKPYQLAPCRYGHHFFLSASRATSFSSTDSAN